MITAICQECNKQFDYNLKPGYPRKYCPECSAKKKAEFAGQSAAAQTTIQAPAQVQGTMGKHDIVITRTEKPHSYEFGKPNNRHKIYYGNIEELKQHLEILKNAGLMEEEIETIKIP